MAIELHTFAAQCSLQVYGREKLYLVTSPVKAMTEIFMHSAKLNQHMYIWDYTRQRIRDQFEEPVVLFENKEGLRVLIVQNQRKEELFYAEETRNPKGYIEVTIARIRGQPVPPERIAEYHWVIDFYLLLNPMCVVDLDALAAPQ